MSKRGKIAVTGASGLVGAALLTELSGRGFDAIRLVRRPATSGDEAQWDPAAGTIDADALSGVTGVVHLAGDNIASGRWSEAKKARILESRVKGTELISEMLAKLEPQPRVLVSASAIGFYGNRGSEAVDERSAPGQGFLADVCQAWEAATAPARDAGVRVVNARIGVVLAAEGGALAKMKAPFLLGIGGRIGDGTQYMSWITLDDLVSALLFAVDNERLRGPVNMVAPAPVTNAELTSTLGRVLKRPTFLPVPKFALRLGAGAEMADEMLLGGARVVPAALQSHGFRWSHPTLEPALRSVL